MKKRIAIALFAISMFANFSYAGIDGWIPKSSSLKLNTTVSGQSGTSSVQQTTTWSYRLWSLFSFYFK